MEENRINGLMEEEQQEYIKLTNLEAMGKGMGKELPEKQKQRLEELKGRSGKQLGRTLTGKMANKIEGGIPIELKNNSEEINVNEYAVVTLTEYGKEHLKNYYMNLFKNNNVHQLNGYNSLEEFVENEYLPLHYKKGGYCQFQLRELMNIFGKCMYNGNNHPPFEGVSVYLIEPGQYGHGAQKVSNALEGNLNQYVVVSLTINGKEHLKNYYMDLFKNYSVHQLNGYNSLEEFVEKKFLPLHYKKGGYCQFQLRELMNIFGKCMYNGNNHPPFEGGSIYFKLSQDNHGAKRVSDEKDKELKESLD